MPSAGTAYTPLRFVTATPNHGVKFVVAREQIEEIEFAT